MNGRYRPLALTLASVLLAPAAAFSQGNPRGGSLSQRTSYQTASPSRVRNMLRGIVSSHWRLQRGVTVTDQHGQLVRAHHEVNTFRTPHQLMPERTVETRFRDGRWEQREFRRMEGFPGRLGMRRIGPWRPVSSRR
jgi:hypothetical protein